MLPWVTPLLGKPHFQCLPRREVRNRAGKETKDQGTVKQALGLKKAGKMWGLQQHLILALLPLLWKCHCHRPAGNQNRARLLAVWAVSPVQLREWEICLAALEAASGPTCCLQPHLSLVGGLSSCLCHGRRGGNAASQPTEKKTLFCACTAGWSVAEV